MDIGSDAGDRIGNYGLLEPDGTAKPSYASFLGSAAGLGVAFPIGSLGVGPR